MGIGTHGIMLHHFHDDVKHIKGQGSISAETFADMLDFYGKKYHILTAEEYLYKSNHNSLGDRDVCITFDDGLLCQYEVAYPVMKDRGLTSFMFVYTSPLDGVMENSTVPVFGVANSTSAKSTVDSLFLFITTVFSAVVPSLLILT